MPNHVTLALVSAAENVHCYYAEAVDLGLVRTAVAQTLTTDLGNGRPLQLRQVGPLIAHYVQPGGVRLSVLLD